MLRFPFHLLLVAVILACPVWCRFGICTSVDSCCTSAAGVADAASACDTCCCDTTGVPDPTADHSCDRPSPDRHPCDHDPCDDRCQCICGGAVASRDGAIDWDDHCRQSFEPAWVVTDCLAESLFCQTADASNRWRGNTPRGTRICCLHMRWQC